LAFPSSDASATFTPHGKSHDAFVYVTYMNGGKPPPPEAPSLIRAVWSWLSTALTRVAQFAFGEDEEEGDSELHAKGSDIV